MNLTWLKLERKIGKDRNTIAFLEACDSEEKVGGWHCAVWSKSKGKWGDYD
jgi:hypothetical protein